MSVFVKKTTELDEVNNEICRYEKVARAKINPQKSVGMRLGDWKGVSLFLNLQLNGRASQDTWYLVWSRPTAEDESVGISGEGRSRISSAHPEESFLEGEDRKYVYRTTRFSFTDSPFLHSRLSN